MFHGNGMSESRCDRSRVFSGCLALMAAAIGLFIGVGGRVWHFDIWVLCVGILLCSVLLFVSGMFFARQKESCLR
ncbi:hypothetical protein BBOMB_0132 [Bifidobacterium bombi DSM 19703]|uniref:Uncharacterized protein n=1 Tax=Bifidobacterium bombi DSM 19703 TaxID=1341695 RepID=A0A080N3V3_9BIFI|nr:hypothetical protein BBOMB_0132 [Bifidobacterium bombi DSM 19703]